MALVLVPFIWGGAGAQIGSTNYEGLTEVRVQTLDHAQLRTSVVFSVYTGIMLSNVELAFRTPDRSAQQFPLSDEQKDLLHAALTSAFLSEFVKMQNLELVDAPGRDVLRLSVRVQDITAAISTGSGSNRGRAAMALRAVGEVTLVLELFDSQTGEILARAVDTRVVEGAAIAQDGAVISKWDGIERLCARWASTARMRLESLLGAR
jgi:hypothetical protein